MTDFTAALEAIRQIGDQKGGVSLLAKEADVPYTTVQSLKDRGWSNKNLEVLAKLAAAAEKIAAQQAAERAGQGASAAA